VLIDGSGLAELMIEFGVAVATEANYISAKRCGHYDDGGQTQFSRRDQSNVAR
jgi:hypothetical protein